MIKANPSSVRNTVRFSESNQENLTGAKSQHNISLYSPPLKCPQEHTSFSDDNLDRAEPMPKPNATAKMSEHMKYNKMSETPYKNMSLAKSVDHLLATFSHTQNSSSTNTIQPSKQLARDG